MQSDVIRLVQSMLHDPKFGDDDVTTTSAADDHSYETVKCRKTDYALDFGDFADEPNDEEVSDEITKYLHADFSEEDFDAEGHIGNFDVLKFWKEKSAQYPKLARYVLSIPCSSAVRSVYFLVRVESMRNDTPGLFLSTLMQSCF